MGHFHATFFRRVKTGLWRVAAALDRAAGAKGSRDRRRSSSSACAISWRRAAGRGPWKSRSMPRRDHNCTAPQNGRTAPCAEYGPPPAVRREPRTGSWSGGPVSAVREGSRGGRDAWKSPRLGIEAGDALTCYVTSKRRRFLRPRRSRATTRCVPWRPPCHAVERS